MRHRLALDVGARMHHHAVTDEPAPTTVRDRLTAAGLSDERIAEHMTAELCASTASPSPTWTLRRRQGRGS